jgi:signal transduction histidine kinase
LFHRLNRDAGYEGTGVGLSICKNIVEKYNGKIWFESEERKGTIFYIKLPKKVA